MTAEKITEFITHLIIFFAFLGVIHLMIGEFFLFILLIIYLRR